MNPTSADEKRYGMPGKAVASLTTGLEDADKVTVAFLVAVGAAESGRPTRMFLIKEAVRLALEGVAVAVACEGCPPLTTLMELCRRRGSIYRLPDLLRPGGWRPGSMAPEGKGTAKDRGMDVLTRFPDAAGSPVW